jgi:hypothetical protein
VEGGVEGFSNFKSRSIEDREPINQKGNVDLKTFVFVPAASIFFLV